MRIYPGLRPSRPATQRRVKLPKPDFGERKAVTVCIAALFQWNYGTKANPNTGAIGLVVTDRMITAGDIQYEPQQTKIAAVTPRTILVIAGDYSLHSQAIKATVSHFRADPSVHPKDIAAYYGRQIQAIKLKEAEDIYLAPVGLNSDSLIAQQKDLAPHIASLLTEQMQNYRGDDVEALIVGSSGDYVQLYGVDTKGIVTCHDDVGFAAIGSGAWHAKSRLMQAGYTNNTTFSRAAVLTFAAKKASEIAPGVGRFTDITFVFNSHHERMSDRQQQKLNELYLDYLPRAEALGREYIDRYQEFITQPTLQVVDEAHEGFAGGDAQTNERPGTPAAETTQRDEGGKG
jgi:20S proteasome alpha/beta subunit